MHYGDCFSISCFIIVVSQDYDLLTLDLGKTYIISIFVQSFQIIKTSKDHTMKKLILFSAFLGFTFCIKAQTVEYTPNGGGGVLTSNGTVETSTELVLAYFKADGTIENSQHKAIGYIKNGTIENGAHKAVGYIKTDGTIEDASHTKVGYIKKDGTIEDMKERVRGNTTGQNSAWAAVNCFFLKIN